MQKKVTKLLSILLLPLILSACGGGGGGGGAAGGAVTVPTCSDTGTAFQTDEYYTIGPNSGGRNNQLELICASSAYARGATGDGITIAVVDTGGPWNAAGSIINGEFDSDATEILKPNNSDYANSDSVPDDQEATHGHGVGVACMIRCDKGDGDMHGVAFDATLNFYKVFDDSGNFVSDAAAANAINDADSNDIINNSWGTTSGHGCEDASTCEALIGSNLYAAMKTATGTNGKILVWAAGNESKDNPMPEANAVVHDTDLQGLTVVVVSVDATNADADLGDEDGKIAEHSNRCGTAATYCIAAPGGNITSVSRINGQTFYDANGTSFAAPLVSGGLALIKQEFSSLTNAQVVTRLFNTALDTGEYSQSSIYGHGLMNLNAATTLIEKLQTVSGSNLLDDPNTIYYDLKDSSFVSSAAFSNALTRALKNKTMEVYDSFDRANFTVNIDSFFSTGSYTSENTIENHINRLRATEINNKTYHENLYGNFTVETRGNYIQNSIFKSSNDFLTLGYNQTTNSFENDLNPVIKFFNDNNFGNDYLLNPYFKSGSGQDYFMSINSKNEIGIDTFTSAAGSDLGLALTLSPQDDNNNNENSSNLQMVLGTKFENNKFLNSYTSGVFGTGDLSNTNFTGFKYKKSFNGDFTIFGSGYAGYTYIDETSNSYINNSEPLLTSTLTMGFAKNKFIKDDQMIGLFLNQPQRVEEGSINLKVPTSSNNTRTVKYTNYNIDLEPDGRQINYDLVFNKNISDLANFSLNFTHVRNADHSKNESNQNFISLFYKKSY